MRFPGRGSDVLEAIISATFKSAKRTSGSGIIKLSLQRLSVQSQIRLETSHSHEIILHQSFHFWLCAEILSQRFDNGVILPLCPLLSHLIRLICHIDHSG